MSINQIFKVPKSPKIRASTVQLKRVRVRLADMTKEREEVRMLFDTHHYLGSPSFIGRKLVYVIELGDKCLGLVSFSDASRQLSARDTYLNWGTVRREQRVGFIIQNDRFLLFPESNVHNLASRVLSLCLKRVAEDWKKHYEAPVLLVETFVDPSRFSGTCYQASNWVRIGETQGYAVKKGGYTYHGQPKVVWIYALCTDARELLSSPELPQKLRSFERLPRSSTILKKLTTQRLGSLLECLRQVSDPRAKTGRAHRISTCLAIMVIGLAAGCEGIKGALTFAETLNKTQLQTIGVYRHPRTRKLRLPSYSSLCRIISLLDPAQIDTILRDWQLQGSEIPQVLAIDGKALRGACAYGATDGLTVVTALSQNGATPFLPKPCSTQKHMKAKRRGSSSRNLVS